MTWEPKCPSLAVDVVCYHPQTRKFAVIERRYPPLGWALPGGFVDIGETVEHAAAREMKEELNVDVRDLTLVCVNSDPARDPRRHVVSIAFVAFIDQEPVAGDDAKNVEMIGFDEVESKGLVFDHPQTIFRALKVLQDKFGLES